MASDADDVFWAFSSEPATAADTDRDEKRRKVTDRDGDEDGGHSGSRAGARASAAQRKRDRHQRKMEVREQRDRKRSGKHQTFDASSGASSSAAAASTAPVGVPWKNARQTAAELRLLSGLDDDDTGAALTGGRESSSGIASIATSLLQRGIKTQQGLPNRSPLLRLHEEILDFAAFVTPTPSEAAIATKALAIVRDNIIELFPHAKVEVFGSRANGLVLPTSDWDIALFGVQGSSMNMRKLASEFDRKGLITKHEVIDSARVPIVKLWEKQSGIQIDISFNARSALVSRALIADYLHRYPPVRPLVLLLKYFLQQRGLNDTYSGGVGSFLLVLMVTHVVQAKMREAGLSPAGTASSGNGRAADGEQHAGSKRKRTAAGAGASAPSSSSSAAAAAGSSSASSAPSSTAGSHNGLNLGTLLLSLLELYGHNLNYNTTGISVRGDGGGCYFSKRQRGWFDGVRPNLLSIENPTDPGIDAGKNSWNMDRVKRAFRYGHVNLSREVREWTGSGSASGNSSNVIDGTSGAKGSSRRTVVAAGGDIASAAAAGSASPAVSRKSILAQLINVDKLLTDRAVELASHRDQLLEAAMEEHEAHSRHGHVGGGENDAAAQGDDDDEDDDDQDGDGDEQDTGGSDNVDAHDHDDEDSSDAGDAAASSTSSNAGPGAGDNGAGAASSSTSSSSQPPPATASGPLDASAIAAISNKALATLQSSLSGTGIVLRRARLIADLMTRRERGVEELAAAPPPYSSYH